MIAALHELRAGDPASVALGRSLVIEALGNTGTPVSAAVLDDAVLAVSELVTNALVAAHERVRVSVALHDGRARVAVYDDGPGDPVAGPSAPDRPHGRGLSIVEIIALSWGVDLEPPGKWVWAEFPVASPAARAS